jgi:hypothetical protein
MTASLQHSYSVSLRFESEDLVPSKITEALGLMPFLTKEPGESGGVKNGLWAYSGVEARPEWEALEIALLSLMDELAPKDALLRPYIEMYNAYWWCGHFQTTFNGGPTLSIKVLRRLAEFGVPLILDNYFSTDETAG